MTTALIQGATGGIGSAFVEYFLRREGIERVFATCRNPATATALQTLADRFAGRLQVLRCDITDESSVVEMAERVRAATGELQWLINASGVLHDDEGLGPERRLEHIEPAQLAKVFAINAFGPLLVLKHLYPLLVHGERAVVAHLSARVGSIGDNKLGGWYGYRASKSALNQFVRGMAIELKRKNKKLVCVAMHPGTVDTSLTKPFQRSAKVLFTPEDSVGRMIDVLEGLTPAQSGGFFAYDGSTIEW
ncbi:MAG: SDR family oxidoreductase [Myxococcota bacterium]